MDKNKENITRTSWQISRSSFSTFSRYSLAIASLRSEPSVFCSIEDITLHEERLKIKKKAHKKNEIFFENIYLKNSWKLNIPGANHILVSNTQKISFFVGQFYPGFSDSLQKKKNLVKTSSIVRLLTSRKYENKQTAVF